MEEKRKWQKIKHFEGQRQRKRDKLRIVKLGSAIYQSLICSYALIPSYTEIKINL